MLRKILSGIIIAILLNGCATSPASRTHTFYCDYSIILRHQLENRGVTVVELGDQILIVIPSSRLFNEMTYQLQPSADCTICLIAQYINSYTKMLVKVAGYTNCTGSSRVNLALSQQQAQTVAKALTKYNVNARVLYAEGYGGTDLVARSTQGWNSDNYRIEITMEKLV